ncbi:hypothetical protein ACFLRF_03220 [Candidatus Altiarchaeota archaeon]
MRWQVVDPQIVFQVVFYTAKIMRLSIILGLFAYVKKLVLRMFEPEPGKMQPTRLARAGAR